MWHGVIYPGLGVRGLELDLHVTDWIGVVFSFTIYGWTIHFMISYARMEMAQLYRYFSFQ
jgi:hypothetical protein